MLVHRMHVLLKPSITMASAVAAQVQNRNRAILRSSSISCHEAKTWSSVALDVGDKFLELSQTPINVVLVVLEDAHEASSTEFSKVKDLLVLLISARRRRARQWGGRT